MSESSISPTAALRSAIRTVPGNREARPRLIVAGATGVLGNEVVRRLVGSGRFGHTDLLATGLMATGLPSVGIVQVAPGAVDRWSLLARPADTGVVMFEPPWLYYGRERSLYTPQPADLPAVAGWMRANGVKTLAVVVPHATGRLPEALKRGLANLDEQAVAALGFERLMLVRSARKPDSSAPAGWLHATAAWMLSTLSYMIPASEQPVRPAKLAEFIEAALSVLPAGTHVASPELLWQANQSVSGGDGASGMQAVVQRWLESAHNCGMPATQALR
jgi:hypothetical protein